MRKLLPYFLSLALIFILVLGFSSCGIIDGLIGGKDTAHTHNYEIVDTYDATCTEPGYQTYVCDCGDWYDKSIDTIEHSYITEVTPPTCTEEGYTTYTCSDCGYSYTADEVNITDHDYYLSDTVSPTCDENGYAIYRCLVCGDSYTTDGAAALGHSYDKIKVTEPTTTSQGYTTYICHCGDSYTSDYTNTIVSSGLEYELSNDKSGYIVTGIGTCEDFYIVIPSEYNSLPVIGIGESAFIERDNSTPHYIKHITIPNTVTTIGNFAFESSSLNTINIPNSVISIGDGAFCDCSSLANITVDEDNTKYKSIDGNLYTKDGKTLLMYALGKEDSTFYIPNTVTSIASYAFNGFSEIKKIVIPDSVTSIGDGVFLGCRAENIIFPDTITSIDANAFGPYGISGTKLICNEYDNAYYLGNDDNPYLILVEAKDYNIESCTIHENTKVIADHAFSSSNLITITMGKNVAYIGQSAFSHCSKLSDIYITDIVAWFKLEFNSYNSFACDHKLYLIENGEATIITELIIPEGITHISGYAFSNCTSLKKVTIPESVTSIGDYAFENCSKLTSITIPDSVTSIGVGAFYGCDKMYNISLPFIGNTKDQTYRYLGDIFKPNADSDPTNYIPQYLQTVKITNETSIDSYAFWGCTGIYNITLNDGIITIGNRAFEGCTYLKSINIPDTVTRIGEYVFSDCENLTNVTIPSVDALSPYAFANCSGLSYVTIGNGISNISEFAFYNCTNLRSVTIVDGVRGIGDYAFFACSKLSNITIPDSITYIGENAFLNCSSLTNVYITDIAAWCKISFGSYYSNPLWCADNLYLTEDGETKLITELVIPEGVTSIGDYAFLNCSSFTSATIQKSVGSIGSCAFEGCSSLASINYAGTVEEWNDINKKTSWNSDTGNYVIYCSDGEIAKDGTVTYY